MTTVLVPVFVSVLSALVMILVSDLVLVIAGSGLGIVAVTLIVTVLVPDMRLVTLGVTVARGLVMVERMVGVTVTMAIF